MLLGTHPEIFGGGEIENMYSGEAVLCACGETATTCSVWSSLSDITEGQLKIARTKKHTLLRKPVFYNRYGAFSRAQFVEDAIRVYRALQESSGKQIIVDSSKNPDRVRALCMDPRIDARVIHLVRDGRANTWSYIRKYNRTFPFIFWWFLTNVKIELLRREISVPWLYVHYDHFAEKPEQTLYRIATMLVVRPIFAARNFREYTHHQIAGNRMRKSGSGVIKRDMAWKTEMPWYQKMLFTLLFGWLNTYYYLRHV